MRKTLTIIFILSIFFLICTFQNTNLENKQNSVLYFEFEENSWKLIASVKPNDSCKFVEVVYQEKYGTEKTILCKAVFENNKTYEYKCVSAELGNLILLKSNLNSFKTKIILKIK